MITNSTLWIIFVVALGLPSTIMGLLVRRLEKRWQSKEDTRVEYEKLMIELTMASLSLSEVTAEAVQKIPEAHCNGEMKNALEWAKEIKHKYQDFSREQTAKAINT